MKELSINIYGINAVISTDNDFVYQNLKKDFALFKVERNPQQNKTITLSISFQAPAYHRIPPVDAVLHGQGLICYKDKNINYVVYSCSALLIYDFKKENGELFGTDEIFLYEKAKLTVLSRIGELQDLRGVHRIHAFGVSLNGKALICLLPMEAGKTTSVINLLQADPQIKIIADDVCFIDKKGVIYPFLLRMGARDKKLIENIPNDYITAIDRPYYGIKYFIDPEFFQNRLSKPMTLTHIFIGKRTFQAETKIEKISKFKCFGPVMESGIFGLGLPQLLEFFVRGDFKLLGRRTGMILSRVFFCTGMIIKTKMSMIKIGMDQQSTCKKILEFLYKEND